MYVEIVNKLMQSAFAVAENRSAHSAAGLVTGNFADRGCGDDAARHQTLDAGPAQRLAAVACRVRHLGIRGLGRVCGVGGRDADP